MIRAQERFASVLDDEELETLMELMEKLIIDTNEASRARWNLNHPKK